METKSTSRINTRSIRTLTAITLLCIALTGLAMLPMARANTIFFETTFEDTIYQDQWVSFEVDLEAGWEVCIELLPEIEECDLDFYVYDENFELIMLSGTASGYEIGYFIVPPWDGTFTIWLHGYTVPEGGVDFIMYVTAGEGIIPAPPPLDPADTEYGNLQSWVNAHRNGMYHGNYHAAHFGVVWTSNILPMWGMTSPTPWVRPLRQFHADDTLIVGSYAIQLPADYYDSISEARAELDAVIVEHFLDGVPLEDYTKIRSSPVRPWHVNGVLNSYYKRMDHGAFKPGELADCIDLGIHEVKTVTTYPDGYVATLVGYFELVNS